MATKKKAAKKAVKAAAKKAVKAAVKKATPAPAAKPATKAATKHTKKPANKVDDFYTIQAEVNDSVGKPISNDELTKAIGVIEGSTGKLGSSAEVRTELYGLLKEWGYTTP